MGRRAVENCLIFLHGSTRWLERILLINVVKLWSFARFVCRIVLLQQNFPQSSETLPFFGGYYAGAARKIILCLTIHQQHEIRRMDGMHEAIRKSNRGDWSSGRFGACSGGQVRA